jgi:hypothetical protein
MPSISGDASTAVTSVACRSPHAGPAGELEHASGRLECLERFGQLVASGKVQALVEVIGGKGPVVGDLLIEEPAEFSAAS